MEYGDALGFLLSAMKKSHMPVRLLPAGELHACRMDMGVRKLLGMDESILQGCAEESFAPAGETVYMLQDKFGCHYLFLLLPDEENLLFVGPYLTEEPVRESILETGEKVGIPPALIREIERYYANVPVVASIEYLFALVDTFCEHIWPESGSGNVVPLKYGGTVDSIMLPERSETAERYNERFTEKNAERYADKSDWNVQLMEQRYAFENELLLAVSRGQIHRAQSLLGNLSLVSFERRLNDPLRNLKNYCIIMNTLLRKAAEKGGVHPVLLDRISSLFASRIEQLGAVSGGAALMQTMFEQYCSLVRQHNTGAYSPPVRRVITAIESDLTQELTLHALAEKLNLSRSYLSSLFSKETGTSITEFVNRRRIEYAAFLLQSTQLQVQTIAQHCGMVDVQYFTKLFKKIRGMTPHAFREQARKQER